MSEMGSSAQSVSPYRAVQVLLNTALEQVDRANQAIETGDLEARSQAVDAAVAIVGLLQDSLDKEQGGELADNLDSLYDYMTRKLAGVALEKEPDSLVEVKKLLQSIKSAWDAIGAEVEAV